MRKTLAFSGVDAITRTPCCPAASIDSRGRSSWSRTVPPACRQEPANACSTSATEGPRNSTPTSRHGGMPCVSSPIQGSAMHSPETNAVLPSTQMTLRWFLRTPAMGSTTLGGLK